MADLAIFAKFGNLSSNENRSSYEKLIGNLILEINLRETELRILIRSRHRPVCVI